MKLIIYLNIKPKYDKGEWTMKRSWLVGMSVLVCLACMGCGGSPSRALPKPTFIYAMDGDGESKEHPTYTTIEELNAHPEKYRDKWVFFQAYIENTDHGTIQNTHAPTFVDGKVNPEIQYVISEGHTNEQAFEDITVIAAYIRSYGTEVVVQIKAYFNREYSERLGEEVDCIKVEEMRLTEWVEDAP